MKESISFIHTHRRNIFVVLISLHQIIFSFPPQTLLALETYVMYHTSRSFFVVVVIVRLARK